MQLEKPIAKTALVTIQGHEDGQPVGRAINVRLYNTTAVEVEAAIREMVTGNGAPRVPGTTQTVDRPKRKYTRKPKSAAATSDSAPTNSQIANGDGQIPAPTSTIPANKSTSFNPSELESAPSASSTGATPTSQRPTPQALALIARFRVAVQGLSAAKAKLSPVTLSDPNSMEAYDALEPARDKIQLVYDEAVRRNVVLPAEIVTYTDPIFDGMEFDAGIIQRGGKRVSVEDNKAEQVAEETGKELSQMRDSEPKAAPAKTTGSTSTASTATRKKRSPRLPSASTSSKRKSGTGKR